MQGSKVRRWLLVILWMGLIFWFSHQPASVSAGMSQGLLDQFINILQDLIPVLDEHIEGLHTLIRKTAHFTIYFILGLLVLNALHSRGRVDRNAFLLTLGICCLYAMTDEYHQTFIEGRSGELRDVLIDTSGAFVGSLFYCKLIKMNKRK